MPRVDIDYPRGFFPDPTHKKRFKQAVASSVARHMDAIDPVTKVKTRYGEKPDLYIDLLLHPYDPEDAAVTTPLLGTIVSYDWEDRMANIDDRIRLITDEVRRSVYLRRLVADGVEAISFTFLDKKPGTWAVA